MEIRDVILLYLILAMVVALRDPYDDGQSGRRQLYSCFISRVCLRVFAQRMFPDAKSGTIAAWHNSLILLQKLAADLALIPSVIPRPHRVRNSVQSSLAFS